MVATARTTAAPAAAVTTEVLAGSTTTEPARGGAGRPQDEERRGGPRLTPKSPRKPEPAIREGVTGHEVDRGVKNQLRTLSKENAEGVAQHLVMVAELLDVEPEAALAHAETAVRRAGRVPAAREALGLVAYRLGDWARALGEFRTVRRLSGSNHLLPLMVDCERALGRHDQGARAGAVRRGQNLAIDDRVELAIVVSGIRRDLGQLDAAAAGLSDLVKRINPNRPVGSPPLLRLCRRQARRRRRSTWRGTGSPRAATPTTSWPRTPRSGSRSSTASTSPTCSATRTTTRRLPGRGRRPGRRRDDDDEHASRR